MSQTTVILATVNRTDEWFRKRDLYTDLILAGLEIPHELSEFFCRYEPDYAGGKMFVYIPHTEYLDENLGETTCIIKPVDIPDGAIDILIKQFN